MASSKPDKILRAALLLELNRETEDDDGQKIKKVQRIVARLVNAGIEGKIDAIKEIWDRVEGKAVQSIANEGDTPFIIQILKYSADDTPSK